MEENDLFISDENKDFSIGLPLTVGVAGEGNKGNDLGHGLENCQPTENICSGGADKGGEYRVSQP